MKNKISENWYKLILGTSFMMASFGFMVQSISKATAGSVESIKANYKLMPSNADGSVTVRLPDDQLNKIIPKNEDGSINIKLSDKQLKELTNFTQDVNVKYVDGWEAGTHKVYTGSRGDDHYAMSIYYENR